MQPFTYVRSENGTRRTLLYAELHSALYSALIDLAQQRAVPIGIRQGRRICYRHSALVALHTRFVEQLAAGQHWAVIQALEAVAARPASAAPAPAGDTA